MDSSVKVVKYFVSSSGIPNCLPYTPIASPAITSTPTYKNRQMTPNTKCGNWNTLVLAT